MTDSAAADEDPRVGRHVARWADRVARRIHAHGPRRPVWDRKRFLVELWDDCPAYPPSGAVDLADGFEAAVTAARGNAARFRLELDAIAAELVPSYRPLPAFAAVTGLRPEEWRVIERRDIDRTAGVLAVRRTISSGKVVELAKTGRSRRQVPLSSRALDALDEIPPRLDTPYLFAALRSGPFDLHNFRRREWAPAIEASGVRRPARIYDLRSTFASNALAAGVSVFELARVMGTSVAMIERHYGTLIEGAGADIARRLNAFDAKQARGLERDQEG